MAQLIGDISPAEMNSPFDAVDHVEVAILVGLHDDLAIAVVDSNVRKHQVLNGVVVPLVAGRALVVPLQLTGVGVDGEDGGDVEIVEMRRVLSLCGRPEARAAPLPVPT